MSNYQLSGAWLKHHRQRLGMTQRQLAHALGQHTPAILAAERQDLVLPQEWFPRLRTLGFFSSNDQDPYVTGAWVRRERDRLRLGAAQVAAMLGVPVHRLITAEKFAYRLAPEWRDTLIGAGFKLPQTVEQILVESAPPRVPSAAPQLVDSLPDDPKRARRLSRTVSSTPSAPAAPQVAKAPAATAAAPPAAKAPAQATPAAPPAAKAPAQATPAAPPPPAPPRATPATPAPPAPAQATPAPPAPPAQATPAAPAPSTPAPAAPPAPPRTTPAAPAPSAPAPAAAAPAAPPAVPAQPAPETDRSRTLAIVRAHIQLGRAINLPPLTLCARLIADLQLQGRALTREETREVLALLIDGLKPTDS